MNVKFCSIEWVKFTRSTNCSKYWHLGSKFYFWMHHFSKGIEKSPEEKQINHCIPTRCKETCHQIRRIPRRGSGEEYENTDYSSVRRGNLYNIPF